MISLIIDGIKVEVPENTTVLQAARKANIKIPTLCYLEGINAIGACRMCLVEMIEGGRGLQASCVLPAANGMVVSTKSKAVQDARKVNLELILSNHDKRCLSCVRNRNCELQKICEELGVEDVSYEGASVDRPLDMMSPSIVRDPNKCILCRRCVAVCNNVQKVGAVGATQRGFKTIVEPVFGKSLNDVLCINCGQCITACPVGALYEKSEIDNVWAALGDKSKYVVVQTAPAVRFGLGEEFGIPSGNSVTGKMATALHRIGFDKVFDTDFAADLTIMEEGTELLSRINNGGKLPMITSCSPGWIKYCELFFPDFLDNLSTCKSPHEMEGALIKSYYAQKMGIDPKSIYVVSIMPCTAKKFEKEREELVNDGLPNVDAVLTTRELARMIKQSNIDFANLPEEDFDRMLGESTGAAVIFGATGGVMEAALRTVADILTGEDLKDIDYKAVRGIEGVKEATVSVAGMDLNVAVANGTGNAKKLLEAVRAGEKNYHFIEIMGCPGGCVTGGGQPIVSSQDRMNFDPKVLRAKATYAEDANMQKRKSHKNAEVQQLYKEFLGEPNGHKSHELLHTHYHQRPKYK
ncbi:MAG: NADH-dependent [FeFe] hydrogenase, group A6 [Eubacteriales bacterium]|nr:NADH-dependent [FeFe] hydrogenase, group A6 [Eubacteriales bacterium]